VAFNGTGAAPLALERVANDGPHSITVPGIVDAWCELSKLEGRLSLARVLEPAIRLAKNGARISPTLANALSTQRARLERGGAQRWSLFDQVAYSSCRQPLLAALLERVGREGRTSFYEGDDASAIVRAVRGLGGLLSEADLAAHATVVARPIETQWGGLRVAAQPPMAQGVLLNMAVNALATLGDFPNELNDHIAIELTEAAFAFRSQVARGEALLEAPLTVDFTKAGHRGGPRAYLHTAGVAAADGEGRVIASLVSVFDDFGSAVYVPELGITLNNRAGGFTDGDNAPAPGKRPVHTLAPVLVTDARGVFGLATPGADGQVQTLLQVLVGLQRDGLDLARAIARPRWRSENGRLLIERSHAAIEKLRSLGHNVAPLADGEVRFGAVVCAGFMGEEPIAAADWRRETWAGVA
jgi:gamma-glutamyltranspeptidase/glutathione hydrolase